MRFGYLAGFTSLPDVIGLENCLGMRGDPMGHQPSNNLDLVVFFGGEDISPALYGQKPVATSAPKIPSHRDSVEKIVFKAAIEDGLPILGICRGAQLACALLGGKLWQDVDHHDGPDHEVIVDGHSYTTNSYHHQMMIPTEEMIVIGYTPNRSPFKIGELPVKDEGDEPEIVFHPKHKVLMIQGHPEWCPEEHDLSKLTRTLVRTLLCKEST